MTMMVMKKRNFSVDLDLNIFHNSHNEQRFLLLRNISLQEFWTLINQRRFAGTSRFCFCFWSPKTCWLMQKNLWTVRTASTSTHADLISSIVPHILHHCVSLSLLFVVITDLNHKKCAKELDWTVTSFHGVVWDLMNKWGVKPTKD